MRYSAVVLLVVASLFQVCLADSYEMIPCNSTDKCPKSTPCCSQYGYCGTGSYCLGGCDIRYSYKPDACMPMPRMKDDMSVTFDDTDLLEKQDVFLGNYSESDWVYTGYIDTHNDALLLQMPNQSTGTVISSTKYFWYGKVSAKLKTSRGGGVITAFILFSDVQDEIDHEFVGYNLTFPETNFYAQGIRNYTNQIAYETSNTFKNYHTYEIDWQEDHIDWLIDGDVQRTLNKEDTWNDTTERYDFPQTPSRIQFSLWPGGSSLNSLGTIEWAGGEVDWNSEDMEKYGYYYAYLKLLTVEVADLPENLAMDDCDDEDECHAFLYNSTDGNADNVYLTGKKTWLGNDDATGLDPDNDTDDEDDTTTVVELSGSTTKTSVKTKSKTSTTSTGTGRSPQDDMLTTTTTDGSYDTSNAIGGFVQDSRASSTTTAGSDAKKLGSGIVGVMFGLLVGVASFAL